MIRKKIVCYIIFIIIINLFWQNSTKSFAEELEEDELYSISAVLIDAETGRTLYGKNQNEVRAMASTTKIMTLACALEYGNSDDIVTVSSNAAKMPDVQLNICEGE